jgi:hypothetical protein
MLLITFTAAFTSVLDYFYSFFYTCTFTSAFTPALGHFYMSCHPLLHAWLASTLIVSMMLPRVPTGGHHAPSSITRAEMREIDQLCC